MYHFAVPGIGARVSETTIPDTNYNGRSRHLLWEVFSESSVS